MGRLAVETWAGEAGHIRLGQTFLYLCSERRNRRFLNNILPSRNKYITVNSQPYLLSFLRILSVILYLCKESSVHSLVTEGFASLF